ncbi:MAG: tRNA (adenosine(37)-N6)-threonylcarbamoyltransferase complex dimerization subunit type 1 TsaB [Candidatus Promineifilaceae bacterium]|nr:tRNA (adenosine(37)-N6)-threonylcarbamoyltransferase complex dimerization subunit type 1 TsaB [Candidatus Promineifilaceae bacterium]
MLLAIDTATRWTGLALYDGDGVVAEQGWRAHNRQTIELAPAVTEMLKRAGQEVDALDALAVALGPGSYTGLRIGLGFAKGLALANSLSLIGVPTLDIVAAAQPEMEGELVVVAEAGRRRISAARYQWKRRQGWTALEQPVNETWETLLKRVEPPVTFSGEISQAALRLIRLAGRDYRAMSPAARVRRAATLAEISWWRLRRGQVDDPAALTPLYFKEP